MELARYDVGANLLLKLSHSMTTVLVLVSAVGGDHQPHHHFFLDIADLDHPQQDCLWCDLVVSYSFAFQEKHSGPSYFDPGNNSGPVDQTQSSWINVDDFFFNSFIKSNNLNATTPMKQDESLDSTVSFFFLSVNDL